MNQKIFEHVKKHLESQGYKDVVEKDVVEAIRESNVIYKDSGDRHRWFILYWKVVCIDGMYIGFGEAECTGDGDADDNCPFEPDDIAECEAVEKVITVYEIKKIKETV